MVRRIAAVLVGAVLLLVGVAPGASAHATVVGTAPGDGSVLPSAPTSVSVVFNERVEAGFGSLRVFAPDGSRVDVGDAAHPAGHADTLAIGLRSSAKGTYTVAWRVVSADSHPISGGFSFSVGTPSAVVVRQAVPSGSRTVGLLFGVARWLAYAGLCLLVGGSVFLLACWSGSNRRARRVLKAAWMVLVVATLGCLLLQGPYAAGRGAGEVFDPHVVAATSHTRLGEALIARLLLLAVAPLLSARPRTTVPWALAMAGTWVVAGHASVGSQVPLALASETLHVTAMAIWFGGLVVLAGILLPSGDTAAIARAVPRFSTLAFGCVAVLAATGTYSAWRSVGTLPALPDTEYGRLLVGKIAGFVVLVGLGALARRRIARRQLSRLGSSVAVEAAVGVSVLALTAVLVEVQPARDAYNPPIRSTAAFDTGGPNGDGTVKLSIDPTRVGYNTIRLDVLDGGRRPERVVEVTAALLLAARQLGPLPVQLIDTGTGHYEATTPVAMPGTWQLRVTVRTDDANETTVAFPVKVR